MKPAVAESSHYTADHIEDLKIAAETGSVLSAMSLLQVPILIALLLHATVTLQRPEHNTTPELLFPSPPRFFKNHDHLKFENIFKNRNYKKEIEKYTKVYDISIKIRWLRFHLRS